MLGLGLIFSEIFVSRAATGSPSIHFTSLRMAYASNPKNHLDPVMSVLQYPSSKDYHLPRKNILVIGCIDLRLTDNLVHFLHFDNLHNRYDHFTLAGASLLCTKKHDQLKPDLFKEGQDRKAGSYPALRYAREVLLDHVQIAIDLHKIEDVYIVEHENCGAYQEFLLPGKAVFATPAAEREVNGRCGLRQGYRIWLGLGFVSNRARKSSFHPALFNLPLIEPFDPSSLMALSAQRRSSAIFCGPLSLRVRL